MKYNRMDYDECAIYYTFFIVQEEMKLLIEDWPIII